MSGSRKGFTLIEILVVVAIVAILSAVIVVGLGPARRQGRDARRIVDLKQVQVALELYFNAYGQYIYDSGAAQRLPASAIIKPTGSCTDTIIPPAIDYGTMGGTGWGGVQGALMCARIGVSVVPDDLSAPSQHYLYDVLNTTAQGYILGAKLEDSSNPALTGSGDLDGTIPVRVGGSAGTINCDDPIYCIPSG